MYTVDQKKWNQFETAVQLKHIASELARASRASLHGKTSDKKWVAGAYERALTLIDASIADSKWKDKRFLYELRDAVASLYALGDHPAVSRLLSHYLIKNQ